MKKRWAFKILGVAGVIFGIMTLKAGGSVLFGPEIYRSEAGNYVPFVVTFNFLAGFFYIAAGIGIAMGKTWASVMAGLIATGTAIVFIALGVHIQTGGPYEFKTVVAMLVRTLFWASAFAFTFHAFNTKEANTPAANEPRE